MDISGASHRLAFHRPRSRSESPALKPTVELTLAASPTSLWPGSDTLCDKMVATRSQSMQPEAGCLLIFTLHSEDWMAARDLFQVIQSQ